jgi:predicted glycoside hydrolase/deacetylase ChbG (UPF0249 family)
MIPLPISLRILQDFGTTSDWHLLDTHARQHGLPATRQALRDVAVELALDNPDDDAESVTRLLDVPENAAAMAELRAQARAEEVLPWACSGLAAHLERVIHLE